MSREQTLVGNFAKALASEVPTVDEQIGENRDYGEGVGPHDEDDQVDALVQQAKQSGQFDCEVYTVNTDSEKVQYPSGREADIVIQADDETVYFEAKLFRFQKANSTPSKNGFAKVFSPYQDSAGQSFIHDVKKIAESDVRATRAHYWVFITAQSRGLESRLRVSRWQRSLLWTLITGLITLLLLMRLLLSRDFSIQSIVGAESWRGHWTVSQRNSSE